MSGARVAMNVLTFQAAWLGALGGADVRQLCLAARYDGVLLPERVHV